MMTLVLLAALLTTPLSGEEVQRLVRQLDSPRLAEREAAEKSLQAAGPGVLEMLPGSETPLSPEVERRITRIRGVVEQKVAQEWVKPTRISLSTYPKTTGNRPAANAILNENRVFGPALNRAELPLGELIEVIWKQTANRVITTKTAARRPINCKELGGRTFWEVVVRVAQQNAARQGEFHLLTPPGHRSVELLPRKVAKPSVKKLDPIGPFLLSREKKGASQLRTDPKTTGNQGFGPALKLQVAWEPRLKPIWLKLGLNGPDGKKVGTYELNPTPERISARLTVPAPVDSQTALSGTLTGLLPAQNRSFRFPLTGSKDREQRFAQVALQLLNVRMEGSEVRLTIRLRYAQAYDALESYRGWFFDNEAYLVNQKQQPKQDQPPKRLTPTGMETGNRTANSIDLIYRFKIDGKPGDYTFIYTTPVALIRVQYDFPN